MWFYHLVLLLHILAATIWVGGHVILSVKFLPEALRKRDVRIISNFEEHFEPIGLPAMLVLLISGIWIAFGHYHISLVDWQQPFVRTVLIKLGMIVLTAIFAVHARFFVIPKLTNQNLKGMAVHIIAVTLLAVIMMATGVQFRFGGF